MLIHTRQWTSRAGTELILRSPQPEEAAEMLAHLIQTHTESYRNLNRNAEYWKNLKVEEEARILKSFVFSESKYFVAAFDGSKIVGALGVVAKEFPFTRHVGGIGMSVQRTYSGQGLATELMKLAIQEAPRAGLSRLELTVRTYNSPAIRVYERLGFRRVGVLKQAAKVGDLFVDEYLYELLL